MINAMIRNGYRKPHGNGYKNESLKPCEKKKRDTERVREEWI
jgi:hypothetical protein